MKRSGKILVCVVAALIAASSFVVFVLLESAPRKIYLSNYRLNIHKTIDTPEGIAAVLEWIDKHVKTLPEESIGAVKPEATLRLRISADNLRRRNDSDRIILLYGEIDSSGSRAISAAAFQELYGYFEKWGRENRQVG